MSSVVIATFPNDPAVLSGQSLGVRTVVDNRGEQAVDSPSPDAPSAFVYTLRSQKEGGPVYGLSADMTARRRSPDRVRSPSPVMETLPPGAKREFEEDIADYWNEGFAPQKYWLTVRNGSGSTDSPKSSVTVLPLNVENMSSFVSEDHLSTVVAHHRQDDQVTLLQRDSEVLDPREGVFHLQQTLPKGGPVSVATAIDVAPAGNGRWFAWMRDGKLAALSGWGKSVVAIAQPIPTATGTLLSPGFQIALATAMFGIVSPDGRLESYVVNASTKLKKRWSVSLGANVGKVRWNAQRDGSVTVAWEETSSGRILRQSFTADGKPQNPSPQALTPGRPTAWGLPPSGDPVVWVLIGDNTRLVLARIPAKGDRALTHVPLLRDASDWDFYQTAEGASALAAISSGKIFSTRLDSPSWKAVRDAPQARGLHLVSLNGSVLWAEWIENGFGLRRCRLQ